jgi:lipopolysaccharide transport system permease protein
VSLLPRRQGRLFGDTTVLFAAEASSMSGIANVMAWATQRDRDVEAVLVIEPRRGWRSLELGELWRYRHLVGAFWSRDIKAAQKQTVLGIAWILVSPILAVATYTIVFGRLAGLPSDGVPYPIFVFAGQLVWSAFASALQGTTTSVVASSQFIQKVYFPRLLIPTTAALTGVLNIAVMLVGLLAVLAWYGVHLTWHLVFAVPIVVLVLATALGMGMLLAPLNVRFRDVGSLIGVAVQLGFYLTPIVYPISLIPEARRPLLWLNPIAGYVTAFRWSLYGAPLSLELLFASIGATAVLGVAGAFYFVRMQGRFADVI